MTRHIAYLTGQYPRATDTFIQREVAALRAQGFTVDTATIRATDAHHHVGPEQKAEHAATFAVMKSTLNPIRLLAAHFAMLRTRPRDWFATARLALQTRPPGIKTTIRQVAYFLEAGVLAHHLRQKGVTHLHNHFADSSCSVAMLMSQMSGIPYSLTMHGPGIFFEPMHWRIDEKIARAAFVACISHFCRAQGMFFSDPAHWNRLKIVHCGVDPARYGQDADRAYAKRVLFVGRLDAVKGVPLLLEAMAALREQHPDAVLTVVGDGPHRARLETQADDLGLAADFVGYKSQDDVATILAASDLLVLPSFAEGVPVVLMEAMAARLPVIASQVAGVGELVETGVNGFTIPAGDLDSLIARMDQLLSDPALCARMGAAGQMRVAEQFDINTEARWLGELLQASLAGTLPKGLGSHC
ncbi:D-inositol-3-phosphate glycosyltransferase (plasmid) [Roseobacter fucihabitans]|uniref:D-inositol-3-phosphate glycosyltransferase n=1 Tax=Roseobacter fucihabitans TaxID=1537242 RepID=A0ABZ2BZC9_9RHOB|nr:glycosyltransferase family 4 protein [Roseobacter litoralis]MBC6967869.1 Alpha-D-kanosaminyltransferase [Roseobacter litoralis]